MSSASITTTTQQKVRLRPIALPVEHGGWGFLFEPIALGLAVAPSVAAAFLALSATGAFLARQPLKIVISDWRRGRMFPRTLATAMFLALYSAIASTCFVASIATARFPFWYPIVIAAPLALIQVASDAMNRNHELLAEIAGSSALASVAMGMVLADGWKPTSALALLMIIISRTVPSILYVRTRLKLDREQRPSRVGALVAHVLAIGVITVLVSVKIAPMLAIVAVLLLLARAVYGLSSLRSTVRAQAVGLTEIGFGAITVALVAVGFAFAW